MSGESSHHDEGVVGPSVFSATQGRDEFPRSKSCSHDDDRAEKKSGCQAKHKVQFAINDGPTYQHSSFVVPNCHLAHHYIIEPPSLERHKDSDPNPDEHPSKLELQHGLQNIVGSSFESDAPCFLTPPQLGGIRRSKSVDGTEDTARSRFSFSIRSLRQDWQGDIGLALFAPLDECAFEPLAEVGTKIMSEGKDKDLFAHGESCTDTEPEFDDFEEESVGESLDLAGESLDVLESSPRLLTLSMMQQIRDGGLHATAQIMRWNRAYSLSRDGDSFFTMIENCSTYKDTIIVARTAKGDILGGYADMPWNQGKRSFYGSGRAFLFATNPALTEQEKSWMDLVHKNRNKGIEEEEKIYIFTWTGSNTYSQVCSIEQEQLAMGGGGSFGFMFQENFTRGSTGPCNTFGNPRLTRDWDGCFDIVDLEVYGLKSCPFGFSDDRSRSESCHF